MDSKEQLSYLKAFKDGEIAILSSMLCYCQMNNVASIDESMIQEMLERIDKDGKNQQA